MRVKELRTVGITGGNGEPDGGSFLVRVPKTWAVAVGLTNHSVVELCWGDGESLTITPRRGARA